MSSRLVPRSWLTAVCAIAAGAAHTVLQSWTILATGLASLREAYSHDQYGYLAMVANTANGRIHSLEPVTETGSNTYPRAYYTLVGLIARALDLPPVSAWNLTALTLQFSMVVLLAIAIAVISRRPLTALVAPLPFLVGNFAWLYSDTSAGIDLQSHAILWGPFMALYSLNAEAAGLCIAVMAMSALSLVWLRPSSVRARWITSLAAAVAIGSLANVQTYSFLAAVYVIAGVLAAFEVYRRRSVVLLVTSIGLVGVIFAVGPTVNDLAGQLPTLLFGLAPFVPGLVALVLSTRGGFLLVGAVAVAFALPQVLITVAGVNSGDPFLTFRIASNVDLGILYWRTLVASGVAIVGLFGLTMFGLWRKAPIPVALGIGLFSVMVIASTNDLWGANAEPYRLWINTYFFSLVLITLGYAWVIGRVPPLRARLDHPEARGLRVLARSAATVILSTVIVASATAPDYIAFANDPVRAQVWNPNTEREIAQQSLALQANEIDDSLIAVDYCVDPRTIKAATGVPMAYYHLGMAWPERYEALSRYIEGRLYGSLDFEALGEADAAWLLTDTACAVDWATTYGGSLDLVATVDYALEPDDNGDVLESTSGTISLFRITASP